MLQELYQELILDHGRSPRNHGVLADANCQQEGHNPLCGDRVTVYVLEQAGVIKDVQFTGDGCAICIASSSLMTEFLKGRTVAEAKQVFSQFQSAILEPETSSTVELGKLAALQGVARYPMRVKCATLPWHTLVAALDKEKKTVCTE